jgi:hypothetical protein
MPQHSRTRHPPGMSSFDRPHATRGACSLSDGSPIAIPGHSPGPNILGVNGPAPAGPEGAKPPRTGTCSQGSHGSRPAPSRLRATPPVGPGPGALRPGPPPEGGSMPRSGGPRQCASAQFAPRPASTTSGTASRTAGPAASSHGRPRPGDDAFHRVRLDLEQQLVMDLQEHARLGSPAIARAGGRRTMARRMMSAARALDRRVDRGAFARSSAGPG